MINDNLPPGCSVNGLPGNRPGDDWDELVWDHIHETIHSACEASRDFDEKISNDIDTYSTSDDPQYVAQCIEHRYLEQAIAIMEEQ